MNTEERLCYRYVTAPLTAKLQEPPMLLSNFLGCSAFIAWVIRKHYLPLARSMKFRWDAEVPGLAVQGMYEALKNSVIFHVAGAKEDMQRMAKEFIGELDHFYLVLEEYPKVFKEFAKELPKAFKTAIQNYVKFAGIDKDQEVQQWLEEIFPCFEGINPFPWHKEEQGKQAQASTTA